MGRKVIIFIAAVFIVVNLTLVLLVLVGGKSTPSKAVLPNPNGYDDFVAGSLRVTGDVSGFATNSAEQLALMTSNNAAALNLLKAGLAKESRVPVEFTKDYANSLMPQVSSFRSAAYVLCAEARLAELEGRTNDAVKGYLNGVRYGQGIARGGLLMSRLVGIACERLASTRLESILDNLDAKNCREIAQALESIDGKEEPTKETIGLEESWGRSTSGMMGPLTRIITRKMTQKALDAAAAKIDANTRRRREVIIKFAAQAYELEKGKRPQAVSDLVPAYLKTAPKDPETGKEVSLVR